MADNGGIGSGDRIAARPSVERSARRSIFVWLLLLVTALAITPAAGRAQVIGAASRPASVAQAWDGKGACLAPAAFNDTILQARTRPLIAGEPMVNETVAGFDLKDQPRRLVSALRALAPDAAAGTSTVDPACNDVDCAAKALFGAEGGRLVHMLVRFGYNGSARAADGASAWSGSELDIVLAAMGDLPGSAQPLTASPRVMLRQDHLSVLKHAPADRPFGMEPVALSGGDTAGVRVSELWDQLQPHERRAVMFHELAHEFVATHWAKVEWRSRWAQAVVQDAAWTARLGLPDGAVSTYGDRNIDEDFAESATAYRYAPGLLAVRAPNRYAFLRDWMFDGLEYFSSPQCMPVVATSELIRRETDVLLATETPPSRAAVRAVYRRCVADRISEDRLGSCALRTLYWERYRQVWFKRSHQDKPLATAALAQVRGNGRFLDQASERLPATVKMAVLSYADTARRSTL